MINHNKRCTLHKSRLEFRFPFDRTMIARIKAEVPGRRWNPDGKVWHCDATAANVEIARRLGFAMSKEIEQRFKAVQDDEPKPAIPAELANRLYPFQRDGVEWLIERNGRALIGDEMGLGKTVQALGYLAAYPDKRALVVCPASLKLNWRKEARMWLGAKADILDGTTEYILCTNRRITIINFDILKAWRVELTQAKFDVLILDEVHYCKNTTAQRTKAVQSLAKSIPHVIALSGTPITNRPMEFFTPINLITPGLFPNRFQYGKKYCNAKHNGFGWDFSGSSNTKELHSILTASIMLRRKKIDVLKDLPAKRRHVIPMDMDANGASEYRTAENNFIKWLRNLDPKKAASAKNAEALVKIGYLKRLAADAKYSNCLAWIRDMLESGGKLVLFAVHKAMIARLMSDLQDFNPVKVDGSVSGVKRNEAVERFQTDDECRVFVGNIQAAGVGITLTAAADTVFLELDWTPGNHDQAEDRVHRIGQTAQSVNAWYLLTENTIESELADLIDHKRKVLTAVLDGEDVDDSSMLSALLAEYVER